jgi:hypothetical protein
MNVYIDISLFWIDQTAIGRLHGSIAFACVPFIGSSITLLNPRVKALFPRMGGFSGLLRVSSVQFVANGEADGVLALLEDINVKTREDGLELARYLEGGFGLFFDEY